MLKVKLFPIGKKNQPRYRIVIAEARSKRGGKYTAKIGFYDPLTDPATIKINTKEYKAWLKKGAKPTPTVRSLVKKYETTTT